MGEMADFTLDYMDDEETLYDYGGVLSCRYCKRSGFHWDKTPEGRWRLVTETGKVHVCKAYRPENAKSAEK
jgi:hypothetical protein